MAKNGIKTFKTNTFLIFLKCVLSTLGILNLLFYLNTTPGDFYVVTSL